MNFEFATAARIVFGVGRIRELGVVAREFGGRVCVVTGSRPDRYPGLLEGLRVEGLDIVMETISGEPTIEAVSEAAARVREVGSDFVMGVGGGSVLDAAKAIATFATNPGDPLEFLEVIGRAKPLRVDPLPVFAIPTTSGTGSEVTRNAVLGSIEHRMKVSLRSPRLLPRVALVDPSLSLGLPPALTASTGMDAFTQLIEPFISSRSNPVTDALCREGLARVVRSLERAYENGSNLVARVDMALASLMSGLALANAGLGAVHGLAGPIGGMFAAPHGALCAALLAPTMAVNLRAIRQRLPGSEFERRFDELGEILTRSSAARGEDAVLWVEGLTRRLMISGLRVHGIQATDHETIVIKASQASSMKANPLPLTHAELREILERAVS
jgi:alcohol dehydrogenase class IV